MSGWKDNRLLLVAVAAALLLALSLCGCRSAETRTSESLDKEQLATRDFVWLAVEDYTAELVDGSASSSSTSVEESPVTKSALLGRYAQMNISDPWIESLEVSSGAPPRRWRARVRAFVDDEGRRHSFLFNIAGVVTADQRVKITSGSPDVGTQ